MRLPQACDAQRPTPELTYVLQHSSTACACSAASLTALICSQEDMRALTS